MTSPHDKPAKLTLRMVGNERAINMLRGLVNGIEGPDNTGVAEALELAKKLIAHDDWEKSQPTMTDIIRDIADTLSGPQFDTTAQPLRAASLARTLNDYDDDFEVQAQSIDGLKAILSRLHFKLAQQRSLSQQGSHLYRQEFHLSVLSLIASVRHRMAELQQAEAA